MKTQSNSLNSLFLVALIFAPAAILLYFWNDLPEYIAVHFQLDGTPNRSDSKVTTLIALTLINAFTLLIVTYAPKIDPKWRANNYSEKLIGLIQLLTAGIMVAATSYIVAANLGNDQHLASYPVFLVAGIFLVIGNYMGKFKPNYFIGIRTPWTLESKEVWYNTHRLGGYVFVIGAIALTFEAIFLPKFMIQATFIVTIVLIVVIPIVYSYFEFQKLSEENAN